MRLLSNPIMIRMGVVLVVMGLSFWIATMLLRRMRRVLTEESFAVEAAPELERLPMHAYNAVIQQLKQQKHELLSAAAGGTAQGQDIGKYQRGGVVESVEWRAVP